MDKNIIKITLSSFLLLFTYVGITNLCNVFEFFIYDCQIINYIANGPEDRLSTYNPQMSLQIRFIASTATASTVSPSLWDYGSVYKIS